MNIGVVGIGLIGGSLAKAFKSKEFKVFASDYDGTATGFAQLNGIIDGVLKEDTIGGCQLIFLSAPVDASISWLKEHYQLLASGTIVVDCCGVKREICDAGFKLASENSFIFIGGHPMAGKQVGGIKNSSKELFEGASFAFVPMACEGEEQIATIEALSFVKEVLSGIGFKKFVVMSAKEHDRIIAYTSQLPHIVANCFVKNPLADDQGILVRGGSFRDVTRVAYMDEQMWAQLFLENKEFLLEQMEIFKEQLETYQQVLADGDVEGLKKLLREGREIKTQIENF